MKLYRFSPIKTGAEAYQALQYVHETYHALCLKTMGRYLPVQGLIVIFCHYDDEYQSLLKFREKQTNTQDHFLNKYFRLHEDITFTASGDTPSATYRYLYIRQPDPWRAQVGDLDFALPADEYQALKSELAQSPRPGVRIFPRNDLDMIELYDPDLDVLAYITPRKK